MTKTLRRNLSFSIWSCIEYVYGLLSFLNMWMMSFGDTEINDVSAIEVFEENNVL